MMSWPLISKLRVAVGFFYYDVIVTPGSLQLLNCQPYLISQEVFIVTLLASQETKMKSVPKLSDIFA